MSVSNPNPYSPEAAAMAAPAAGVASARMVGNVFSLLAWGLWVALAVVIVFGLIGHVHAYRALAEEAAMVSAGTEQLGEIVGEQRALIAAAVLWIKFAIVAALYWSTAIRGFGHAMAALRLSSVAEASGVDLRATAKDKFSRAASLLGDMNLAMCFELFIVFFSLLAWTIFAFNWTVLVLTIAALPVAVGHWFLTIVVQDNLGERVERV